MGSWDRKDDKPSMIVCVVLTLLLIAVAIIITVIS